MMKKPKEKKSRRFRVWLDRNVIGSEPSYEIVELPLGATEDEIYAACSDCLDTMIANELDTGWEEI